MDTAFYVYILASKKDGTRYIGVTNDLARRISEHKAKLVPGFTRQYGVDRLVYFESYDSILEARAREHVLKRWRRAWKVALIEKLNPDWRDLSDQLNSWSGAMGPGSAAHREVALRCIRGTRSCQSQEHRTPARALVSRARRST